MKPSSAPAYRYVCEPGALTRLLEDLRPATRVAIDTEANSLHCYHQRVCLIQLSFLGEDYIVDPLAPVDLSALLKRLAKKHLLFHAADYDLRMMRSTFDFEPKAPIFDTMVAAQLIGSPELGLVAVSSRFLDVELTKHGQKSNWSRRPLSEAQLDYAADDTRHLEALADKLAEELKRLGRESWHEESCARVVASTTKETPRDPDQVWRIKGSGLLSPHEQSFVKALWHWREEEASVADIPPFKVLGNARLTELAQWHVTPKPKRKGSEPSLPRSCVGRRLKAYRAALSEARALPKREWPKPRPHAPRRAPDGGQTRRILAHLQTECAALAQELDITPGVLAPKACLTEVARHLPTNVSGLVSDANLMKWQAKLVLPILQEVL